MRQLDLLEPDPHQDLVHLWQSLGEEQRAHVVAALARVIAAAAIQTPKGHDDDREQQDHP